MLGNGTHKLKCRDCTETDTPVACSGGVATCEEEAVCDVCGEPYGIPLDHSFTTLPSSWIESAATCTDKARHYIKCDRCEEVCLQTVEVGNPLGHDFDGVAWQSDAQNFGFHSRACKRGCATGLETRMCSRSNACTQPDACSPCGAVYAQTLGHDYSGRAAVCTTAQFCARTGCGAVLKNKLGHYYGEWTGNGDKTHSSMCVRSGCQARLTKTCESYTLTTGDGLASVCPVCGAFGERTFEAVTRFATQKNNSQRGELAVRGMYAPFDGALYAFTVAYEYAGCTDPLTGAVSVSLPLEIADDFTLVRVDVTEGTETETRTEKWTELDFTYSDGVLALETDAAGLILLLPLS